MIRAGYAFLAWVLCLALGSMAPACTAADELAGAKALNNAAAVAISNESHRVQFDVVLDARRRQQLCDAGDTLCREQADSDALDAGYPAIRHANAAHELQHLLAESLRLAEACKGTPRATCGDEVAAALKLAAELVDAGQPAPASGGSAGAP